MITTENGAAKRSRRRGAELDAAVLDAVLAELDAHGYFGVTFEGVARRARTSKPVLYRRWSSRAEMVVAAWKHDRDSYPAIPDTGSLAGDLKSLLHNLATRFAMIGREVTLGILSELSAESASRVADMVSGYSVALIEELIARARRRGEVGPEPLPQIVISLPLMMARHHCIMFGVLDDDTIDGIVDTIFLPLVRRGWRQRR